MFLSCSPLQLKTFEQFHLPLNYRYFSQDTQIPGTIIIQLDRYTVKNYSVQAIPGKTNTQYKQNQVK